MEKQIEEAKWSTLISMFPYECANYLQVGK